MFDTAGTWRGSLASGRERAGVLALVAVTETEWHRTAVLIDEAGSALRLLAHDWSGLESFDVGLASDLAGRVREADLDHYQTVIRDLAEQGIRLVTILDDDYPTNLREIYNRPPLLFTKGSVSSTDVRAVAVVGTRAASPEGLRQATALAHELAVNNVTVLSGLARGIDTAAHRAALRAGGRTIAVLGSGINYVYPPENRRLADEIAECGALVSQFWPDAPPTRTTFPMRNAVMSGMSVGTVVVEAKGHSGARMQARLALLHGKRVFLFADLVTREPWAREYARRGATAVKSVDDILEVVTSTTHPPRQLALA